MTIKVKVPGNHPDGITVFDGGESVTHKVSGGVITLKPEHAHHAAGIASAVPGATVEGDVPEPAPVISAGAST